MKHVKLAPFQPLEQAGAVFRLWNLALGQSYPVSERVFRQNSFGNFLYQPGDGVIAFSGGRPVGFALASFDEHSARPGEGKAALSTLLVRPDFRRRGLGGALLAEVAGAMKRRGAVELGAGSAGGSSLFRFWPGVPDDLPAAVSFFENRGFRLARGIFDLIRDVRGYTVPERIRRTLQSEEAEVGAVSEAEIPRVLEFEQREFPEWSSLFRLVAASGDWTGILALRSRGRLLGTCFTCGPASRYRPANLAWETLLGTDLGGLGAVGVAKRERGRGLGVALVAAATEELAVRGAGKVVVDWTHLSGFYGKIGYSVWKEYWLGSLVL